MIFKRLKQQHLLEEIYGGFITLDDALEKQIKLKDEIDRFKESTRLKVLEKKEQKVLTFNNTIRLFEGKQKVLNISNRKTGARKRTQITNSQTNASKIANGSCRNKST